MNRKPGKKSRVKKEFTGDITEILEPEFLRGQAQEEEKNHDEERAGIFPDATARLAAAHQAARTWGQDWGTAPKDLQLWAKEAARERPLSEIILDPVRLAMQKKKLASAFLLPGGAHFPDTELAALFGPGVADLQRHLGRLVLDAVLRGDRRLTAALDDAIKDANALFHRSVANIAFFNWYEKLEPNMRHSWTVDQMREPFQKQFRAVNHAEWTEIQRTFFPVRAKRTRRGRPPKLPVVSR